MRFMVIVKATEASERGEMPSTELLEAMGAYNEELVKAGIMLDGNGLLPSATGARVVFQGGTTSVVDGPFTESKELIGGYWIWEVDSLDEAVEWARRCPSDPASGVRSSLEIRQIAEAEDFGDAYTPEQQERDVRIAEEIRSQHPAA
jgi:hypothetical protein